MASALTILFLGCWLAGQSGVSGEGTNLAETQESNPPSNEPEKEEGNDSPETDPHLMDSEGKDAGSSPTQRTNPTQPRATLTPAHPGGTGPGGTGLTRSGTTPTSTCPCGVRSGNESGGSESPSTPPKPGGSEPSPAPGPTRNIIAGVSAVAAGLFLLLLVIFLCYRRKGPAPRQSRESEPATTVYALMGEGKQLDVLPQKPDPGTEGHTYAELDGQALQAPLYSTITMSQGPNGQSPQGAGEPPTDPDSVNPGGVTGETGQEASATTG